jgi:hypothetical protein
LSTSGAAEVAAVKGAYSTLLPLMAQSTKAMIVAGTFGCSNQSIIGQVHPVLANGTDSQTKSVLAKLDGLFEYANSEPRIGGFMPWHYANRTGNMAPSCPCDMRLGAESMPAVVAKLTEIGRSIVNGSRAFKTDDTTSAELESVDLSAPAPPPCAGILLWNGICSPVDYPNYSMADSYGGRVSSLQPLLPPYLTPAAGRHPTFCAGCNEPGNDYSILNLTTVKACALACEYDSRCKSWTFSLPATDGKGCYLKDKVAPAMDCSRPKAVVSGCSETLPVPIPAGCACHGHGRPGGGPGSRPAVVNNSMGRQLFVDDFLIQSNSGIVRTFFSVNYDSRNPILAPTEPWELSSPNPEAVNSSTAMAYSGGVAYDAAESSPINRYKLWYSCGMSGGICLARSADGLDWRNGPAGYRRRAGRPSRPRGPTLCWMFALTRRRLLSTPTRPLIGALS